MRHSRVPRFRTRAGLFALCLTALSVVGVGPALGATLTVCASGCQYTTIQAALDASSNGDTIAIGPGTYAGGFGITKNVSLVGAGSNMTTITGGGTVVGVAPGVSAAIRRVAITGGTNGGIFNNGGTLTLEDSTVSGNTSGGAGGGITNSSGVLTVRRTTISGNTAADGAGIMNGFANCGSLTVEDTTISGNTAANTGGGISSESGCTLQVTGSILSGNMSRNGGGIASGGALTVQETTVRDNTAGRGGGINTGGSATIAASTIRDNHAGAPAACPDVGPCYVGGGIFAGGALALEKSTVTKNSADVDGGGIFKASGTVTLTKSKVTKNTPNDCVNC